MRQRLDTVFGKLRAFGLNIKPQKCSLFRREVKCLGHIVSAAGVTDPEKIKAVQEWEEPTSQTELRSFLGLAGYFYRYVPSFAQIAKVVMLGLMKAWLPRRGGIPPGGFIRSSGALWRIGRVLMAPSGG